MKSLRVLIVEDNQDDAELLVSHLKKANYDVEHTCVATADALRKALADEEWDVVLSDYGMRDFTGLAALQIVQETGLDLPFIIISGSIGEETAASLMRHGVSDYLMKDNLSRLAPAIAREIQEAGMRREKREAERALAESEERLQLALSAAGMGAWEWDLKTDDVFWSPECSVILGISVAGAKSKDTRRWMVDEDREMVEASYQLAIEQRSVFNIRFRIKRRTGDVIWVAESGRCEYDAAGEPLRIVGTLRDITRDKLAEDALIEAEERYRIIAETASDGVISINQNSEILFANPAAERIFGYSRSELIGQPMTMLMPERLSPLHLQGIKRYTESGERKLDWSKTEAVGRRKDGTEIVIQISFGVYRKGDNFVFTGFIRDITDAKRDENVVKESERNLRESETRYRHLFENNPYPMWVYDVETLEFLAVNDAAVYRYGYTIEEFNSMTIADIRPAEDVPKAIEKAKSTKRLIDSTGDWRHKKKDGTVINVEITSHALEFEGRKARLVLAHDVSDRLRAEKAVKRSEAKYRELFENANDLIYTHDLTGKFTSLNHAGERLTGYTEAEAASMNISDIVDPEFLEQAKASLKSKITGAPPPIFETEIVAKDGRRVPLEISTRLVYEGGKPVGVQGIGRDISERRAAQEALRLSEDQLRQSQKLESIGNLAGGMAHDFNNMLTAINGYSDLILRKIPLDDPIRQNVKEIRKAGERSAELTSQLLAFSRRQILQPHVLDLNDVIAETSDMLKRLIGEDVDIKTNLARDLDKVEADPGQLSQVLVNLVINSRDAMRDGGTIVIETSNVLLDAEYASRHIDVTPGNFVMLAVSDTGTGMDEVTQKRVFEPFFTTKSVGRGTGLGLSTVYGIVKQSGGNIWVYSEPGMGTTFKIYLPQVDSAATRAAWENSQQDMQLGSEAILLVEDEETVRNLAKEILEACGYTVVEASNGTAAVEFINSTEKDFDLLITDIVMPSMGGRELAEHVTAKYPAIKILFTSGYTDDAVLRHGIIDEGTNFLQKPFTFDALSRKVRSLLDS